MVLTAGANESESCAGDSSIHTAIKPDMHTTATSLVASATAALF